MFYFFNVHCAFFDGFVVHFFEQLVVQILTISLQNYVECDRIYPVNNVIKKKEDNFSFGCCLLEEIEKEKKYEA